MKIKPKFCFRGWDYILRKDWYSLHRWKNIYLQYDGTEMRLIDCGCFSIGYILPPKGKSK